MNWKMVLVRGMLDRDGYGDGAWRREMVMVMEMEMGMGMGMGMEIEMVIVVLIVSTTVYLELPISNVVPRAVSKPKPKDDGDGVATMETCSAL